MENPSPLMFGSTPLSVLDTAPVVEGGSARDALLNSIELAGHVESLGYGRHWVAEHHNLPGIASSATAVLMAHLADATTTIRIGSGGIMLPNHSPLIIAEQFGTLEALHPGRIDLGIGRAPGTDPLTARALRRLNPQSGDDLPELLGELIGFFTGDFPETHPYRQITAQPGLGNMPAIWLLGSSGYSAQLAGVLGLPFSFAHHFSARNTLAALQLYREHFRPSAILDVPYVMLAVMVVCGEDDEDARRLSRPGDLSFVLRRLGRRSRLVSNEEADQYPYDAEERVIITARHGDQAVGGPATVKERLRQILDATEANELMATTMTYRQADRLASYDRLATLARG